MKNKRIFVTGGAGVIGKALVNLLLDLGSDVFVGDLKSCPSIWNNRLKYWQGDLNEIDRSIIESFDPQIIFSSGGNF